MVVESRTEQLTMEKLEWATKINPKFSVAIGLKLTMTRSFDSMLTKASALKAGMSCIKFRTVWSENKDILDVQTSFHE